MSAATLPKVRRPPCGDPLRRTRRPTRSLPREIARRPCGVGAATSPLTNVTRARPLGPPRPARDKQNKEKTDGKNEPRQRRHF